MTLQEFIDFDLYVRCFTFGKTDITPVAYDPRERRYLVEHEYLSPELGARVVRDAQTINLALGYEMNTIEFAIQDGVPYAIDYLNPAPDFERDRITDFYFRTSSRRWRSSSIDRALNGRSVAVLAALGGDARHRSGVRLHRRARRAEPDGRDRRVARAAAAGRRADAARSAREFAASMRARKLTFGDRVHCPFLRPFFLTRSDEARIRAACRDDRRARRARRRARRSSRPRLFDAARRDRGGRAAGADRSRATPRASTASRLDAFLLPDSLHFAEYNAESPAGPRLYRSGSASCSTRCRSMARFRERCDVRLSPTDRAACSTRCSRATANGAARPIAADDRHRRLARGADLDRVRDPARRVRRAPGVPTVVCDPRDLDVRRTAR